MTSERVPPPSSPESEMSILGAVLMENAALGQAQEIISADSFYRLPNRLVFEAMCSLDDKGSPIDEVTLSEELKQRGDLDEIGGSSFLYTLSDFVPMAANVAYYCRIVEQKAAERKLIANATEAVRIAYSGEDFDGAVAKLEAAMPNVRESTAPVGMSQTVRDMVKRVEYRHEHRGEIHGLPYGIGTLDRATLGMHGGELIIVAGRPSMGKSAFAGNIVASVCKQGGSAMLFTLEMGRVDICDRIAASYNVKYQNIRSGMLAEAEWPKLAKAASQIVEWNLLIDDTAAISLRELRAKAKRQKRKPEGLNLLVIDYLQLMSLSDPKMSRVQGIGEISRGLKQLAKELEIPVIALSQLSRSVDSRNDKRPMMSDLRDSGEIEQDADVILFPYRPAAYCEMCRDKIDSPDHDLKAHQGKAEIIIEKQRAGERNLSIPVTWLGEFQRFEAMSNEPEPY